MKRSSLLKSAKYLLASLFLVGSSRAAEEKWLRYEGGEGAGKGKHVVLIAAEQEYRSEQFMPMMARMLSTRHGFDCTVLFGVNPDGLVDPTMAVYPEKGKEAEFVPHDIPGLEMLEKADVMIFATRLLTLPDDQLRHFVNYFDSGKPFIALRTANHGFVSKLPYEIDGKPVNIGQILGGTFLSHHGNWSQDSTRGDIIPERKDHPLLIGVKDIWGLTDVYRTYKDEDGLPADCIALVNGQPLIGREPGGADNPNKKPLPVVWVKDWTTSKSAKARVLHCTMGSGKDFENPGLRRLISNGVYWGLGMEKNISAESSVDYVGPYQPLSSGFHYEKLGIKPQPVSSYR